MNQVNKIKTRFAPSPTGELHIGGARTALFNYLFAKQKNGEFILRIEDTDRSRYVKGSIERIQEDLSWLGLKWDQGPNLQSTRLKIYQEKAKELVDTGKAYRCFCTEERLNKMRKEQIKKKIPSKYDRKCLHLPKSKIDELLNKKIPYTVRLLVPDKKIIQFSDLVFGDLEFKSEDIDDQILLKSDGYPTYHLANVVDDHMMEITHIIRGDEWLPSAPKHILLYQAFGWKPPEFAHLPLIVDQNRRKLSKREHGKIVWVSNYKNQGYLPEALLNFLAFLGWHPGKGETREIYLLDELIKVFSLKNIHKSPAVFDIQKLNDINAGYLKKLSEKEIINELSKQEKFKNQDKEFLSKLVKIYIERAKKFSDFIDLSIYLFKLPDYKKELLIFKKSDKKFTKIGLKKAMENLEKLDKKDWQIKKLNQVLADIVKKEKLKNGDIFWPVRVALSGIEKSPSPEELLWILGKEKSIERLKKALEKLEKLYDPVP